jgi:putative ABC transport system permease protein
MMKKLLFNFQLALEGVAANRLRAFLTALGIVFGVAAVIAMLAIGTGAREAILAQMRLIGANNIVVTSLMEAAEEDASAQSAGQEKITKPWSPGLNLGDVRAIHAILPGVEAISPEIVLPTTVIRDGKIGKSRAVGVTNAFFELNNLQVERGKLFHDVHQEKGDPVCIVGQDIVRRYFSEGNPIGERIKCGQTWLRIIGVLKERIAKKDQLENLGIRDYNQDIYMPLQTALIRFKDRSFAHSRNIGDNRGNQGNGGEENYHQLDRMVIRVAESEELLATSNVVARLLKRRHQTVIDYEMAVPEKMLEAQQQTQDTFNKVLAFIAGISLLVGGIGIMNIMLASVLERTKEIGTRRSLGATQQDIVQQFLLEAVFISLMGGITGILLGVGASEFIGANYDIPTEVSAWSVILSFGVASIIGLVFGLFPARRAAKLDPIKALRSD